LMETISTIFLFSCGGVFLVALGWFGVVSLREREFRPARMSFGLALVLGAGFWVAAALPPPVPVVTAVVVWVLVLAGLMAWFLPIGRGAAPGGQPDERVDERDIMFARTRLEPGTREYDSYYARRPENQAGDDKIRALPGLLSDQASLADPDVFATTRKLFQIAGQLREKVDGPVAKQQEPWCADEAARTLKQLALSRGAISAGITELNPNHIYSHVGRGTGGWGTPIQLSHRYAIAFALEMDHGIMRYAPAAPVVAESARRYVQVADIAVGIADAIRAKGYAARAHVDGNYQIIAPLVARDAGLGEIGRMGILMTPRLGPRVRLGVVTTDLPLVPDKYLPDNSVIDFCTICRKCADVCPSAAIPTGIRTPIGSSGQGWALDATACFKLWNLLGTDCGRCMAVCPYSHPDNLTHNLARWAAHRSGFARRLLLVLDDVFYGRRPKPLA
jgi:ferredoxin